MQPITCPRRLGAGARSGTKAVTHRITTCSCPGGSRRGAQCPTCGFSGKKNSGSKARVSDHHPCATRRPWRFPGQGWAGSVGRTVYRKRQFFSPDIPSPCQKKVKTLSTYFTPCPTRRCQNRVANRVALISVKSSIRLHKRLQKYLLVHAWFRAMCMNHCAPGGGAVAAADDDDMFRRGEATETPPAQQKEEEAHTAVSAVQILGSGGVGDDGGAGARPTFVAGARRSNAPGTCGNSYVAPVMQPRVSILMSALNWACAQTSGRRQPPPRRAVRRRWVRRIGKTRVRSMRAQRAAATGTAPRQRRPCPALLPTSRREQRPRTRRRASSRRRRPRRRLAPPDTEAVVVASASAAAAAAVTAPTAAAGGLAHTPGPATPSNGGASAGRPPRSVAPSPRRPAADAARSGGAGGAAQRG